MKRVKLIIADGDPVSLRHSFERLNAMEDVQLLAATMDGEELLREVDNQQADVVLTSLLLKNVDGLGVLEAIRRMRGERPKVLVLTNVSRDSMIENAFSLGAAYYMLKPADYNIVHKRICQLADETARDEHDSLDNGRALIHTALREMGIMPAVKGHRYLVEAALMGAEDATYLDQLTGRLYPDIAKKCNATPCGVERAIRTAIHNACRAGSFSRYAMCTGDDEFEGERPSSRRLIKKLLSLLQIIQSK